MKIPRSIALGATLLSVLFSCKPQETQIIPVASISVNPTSLTLEEGENRRSLSESVVGNLRMWKYLLDPEGADRALHTWDHISSLWNDLPIDFKGDSPFHETKMCLEILGLFD